MTPKNINQHVNKLVEIIDPSHEPLYVDVKVEKGAAISDCFQVVQQKVKNHGSKMIFGWQIWETNNLIEAECHAIWESPRGVLVDITPKEFPVSKILFVEDEYINYTGEQIDNVRLNKTDNPLVDDLITVCKCIFEFYNRGERAKLYDLSGVLNSEQVGHLQYLKYLQQLISFMIEAGNSRDSACGCGGRKKYKDCHGENLVEKITKVQ